jgi:D-3-phosphoglycerate dehydrogenase / 2-oxoglutarate reductase
MTEKIHAAPNLSGYCVLVTPTTFGKGDPALKTTLEASVGKVIYNPHGRPLSAAELIPLVREADGFIAGLDQIDASVIEAAGRLKVIARYGVGIDRVEVPAATRRGIVVTNTPGANSAAVAEMAIALMLTLGRDLCRANRSTRKGEWPRVAGIGLRGKTVGLIGFGAIGREMAARLKGFGCRLLVSDPFVKPEALGDSGVELVSLDALLTAADFVSLHAAVTSATQDMVNSSFLGKMKPGAFLVNTARGELIDEGALKTALESGRLRGAALDCFNREPPGADHPLFKLPQVLVTPHMASHTDEAASAMGWMSLKACLAALRGERAPHTVNPEVYAQQESRRSQ